jgi:hypothetical protein
MQPVCLPQGASCWGLGMCWSWTTTGESNGAVLPQNRLLYCRSTARLYSAAPDPCQMEQVGRDTDSGTKSAGTHQQEAADFAFSNSDWMVWAGASLECWCACRAALPCADAVASGSTCAAHRHQLCTCCYCCRAAHGRLPYKGSERTLVAVLTSD